MSDHESDAELYRNTDREAFIGYVNVDGYRGERLSEVVPGDELASLGSDEIYIEADDGNILGIYSPARAGRGDAVDQAFYVIDMDKNLAWRQEHPGADIIAEPLDPSIEVEKARTGSHYKVGSSTLFGVKEIVAVKITHTKIDGRTRLPVSPGDSFSDIRHRFRGMLGLKPKTAAEELGR